MTLERCKGFVANGIRRCSRKARKDGYCRQHHPDIKIIKQLKQRLKGHLITEFRLSQLLDWIQIEIEQTEKKLKEVDDESA